VALLSRVTGMSRTTIAQGQRELVGEDLVPADRVRRPGGGRKPLEKKRPDLTQRLDDVMEGATAGDPMSAVKWTRKSTRAVSRVLRISHTKAWKMLRRAKYRLRFNRKRLARRSSPDRSQQFTNINKLKDSFAERGQPVISVDVDGEQIWLRANERVRARLRKPT
jgi:hypothetical protein